MQVGTTSSTAVDPLPELGNIAKVSTYFLPESNAVVSEFLELFYFDN